MRVSAGTRPDRRGNFYLGQVIDDHLREDSTIESFVGRLFR